MATTKKPTKPAAAKVPKTPSASPKTVQPAPKPPESAPADKTAGLSREAGTALLEVAQQVKGMEGAAAIAPKAQALAKGDQLSNAALRELKAAVNTLAAKLRAEKRDSLARQLASANRTVRRLERASRKA